MRIYFTARVLGQKTNFDRTAPLAVSRKALSVKSGNCHVMSGFIVSCQCGSATRGSENKLSGSTPERLFWLLSAAGEAVPFDGFVRDNRPAARSEHHDQQAIQEVCNENQ
jgi:hypothetical protein